MTSGRRPVTALLTLWLAMSHADGASAQAPRLEADVSGSRIEYDTLSALDALSLSLLSEWQLPSLYGRVTAGVTGFGNEGTSVQARGSLSGWMSPGDDSSPLRFELGGGFGGSHHSRGFDVAVGRADARMHMLGRTYGAWLGAGLSSAKNSYDSSAVWGVMPNVGAWWQGAYVRGTASYLYARIDGQAYPETDLALTVSRGPVDVSVYAGVREWPYDTGAFDEVWAGGTAAYWVSRNAALTVAGGKYPADVMQGVPGGRFLSLGLRFTPRRIRPIPLSAVAPIVFSSEDATRGGIGFDIDGADSVEIAGDWNGWTPEPMVRDGRGRWLVPPGLQPGVYRFNLRLDGEVWFVPEGVPTVEDGFGGTVGVLIVAASGDGM